MNSETSCVGLAVFRFARVSLCNEALPVKRSRNSRATQPRFRIRKNSNGGRQDRQANLYSLLIKGAIRMTIMKCNRTTELTPAPNG